MYAIAHAWWSEDNLLESVFYLCYVDSRDWTPVWKSCQQAPLPPLLAGPNTILQIEKNYLKQKEVVWSAQSHASVQHQLYLGSQTLGSLINTLYIGARQMASQLRSLAAPGGGGAHL